MSEFSNKLGANAKMMVRTGEARRVTVAITLSAAGQQNIEKITAALKRKGCRVMRVGNLFAVETEASLLDRIARLEGVSYCEVEEDLQPSAAP